MTTGDLTPAPWETLFDPAALAVIGASSGFGKWGQLILTNIVAGGFKGRIYPVNPKEKTLCGLPVYPRIEDVPGPVDVAFVTTPAESVAEVVAACGRRGVKGLVIISSGFSETGAPGARLEEQVGALCRRAGMRLVGPNTMGIICPYARLFATGSHTRPRPGGVAFISQSGNLGNQLIHWAEQQGVGVSLFVGSGNEALADCTDFLEYLEREPHTRMVVLYLESAGDGRRFLEVVRRVNLRKPVVVLKGGRTEAGRIAAASHTGSMSGDAALFRAACRQAGVLDVRFPWELLDLSAGFSALPLPRGNRVGIVTLGGGWGVVTADACNNRGLVVPPIPGHVVDAIGRYLPPFWSRGNPVDLVGTRDLEVPLVAVEELLKWEGVDAVISLGIVGRLEMVRLLIGSTRAADAQVSEEFLAGVDAFARDYEQRYIARVAELMEIYRKPVIGVSLTSGAEGIVRPVPGRRYSGVFYQSPENAVNVLARMAAYRKAVAGRPGAG